MSSNSSKLMIPQIVIRKKYKKQLKNGEISLEDYNNNNNSNSSYSSNSYSSNSSISSRSSRSNTSSSGNNSGNNSPERSLKEYEQDNNENNNNNNNNESKNKNKDVIISSLISSKLQSELESKLKTDLLPLPLNSTTSSKTEPRSILKKETISPTSSVVINNNKNDKQNSKENKKENSKENNKHSNNKDKENNNNNNSIKENNITTKKSKHSNHMNSSSININQTNKTLASFSFVSLFIVFVILGDRFFIDIYNSLSPKPMTHSVIPYSQRFFDSRILSTGIVTPVDNEITNSPVLNWWIDGALFTGSSQRNITLNVFLDDKKLNFPGGNTLTVDLNGKLELQVSLEKYGLNYLKINNVDSPGAHEIILEVCIEPLPSDLFYSHSNYGKKLLSAVANTTFYYIPPTSISQTIEKNVNESENRLTQDQFQEITKNNQQIPQDQPNSQILQQENNQINSDSTTTSTTKPTTTTTDNNLNNDNSNANTNTPVSSVVSNENTFIDTSILNDKFPELKPVYLYSKGGCNEQQGLNTLVLSLSLNEKVFTIVSNEYTPSETFPPYIFGKAIVVVGEEIFDISGYIEEQTASQSYRLLPSPNDSENPSRIKEVILRLKGVQYDSKHAVQVFFCSNQYHNEIHGSCMKNAHFWDATFAVCK